MKQSGKSLLAAIRRLHQDRHGAEGLEKLLIIAAITLPLLGLLLWLRNDIQGWVTGLWEGQKGDAKEWDYGDAVE